MKSYILFIDSGSGGLSILEYFLKQKNDTNVIYYADAVNFPYGNKDEAAIGNILLAIYENLKSIYDIRLITIACNTASISGLDFLREHVDLPVIGTVPAVKVASENTVNGRIGIIGTETSIRQDYIKNLIDNFAGDKKVFVKATKTLADAVEYSYSGKKLSDTLEEELGFFKDKDIDSLVLGCTHYSLLHDEIYDYFGGKVRIVDSCEGVSKRIIHLMPDNVTTGDPEHILYISKNDSSVLEKYKNLNSHMQIFNEIITKDLSCRKE